MVEGARLESVYTGNRIEGSNPSLSAESDLKSLTDGHSAVLACIGGKMVTIVAAVLQ